MCCTTDMQLLHSFKACPHCRRKVRLSPLSRRFLRQSHFSATVWTGLYCIFFNAHIIVMLPIFLDFFIFLCA